MKATVVQEHEQERMLGHKLDFSKRRTKLLGIVSAILVLTIAMQLMANTALTYSVMEMTKETNAATRASHPVDAPFFTESQG